VSVAADVVSNAETDECQDSKKPILSPSVNQDMISVRRFVRFFSDCVFM